MGTRAASGAQPSGSAGSRAPENTREQRSQGRAGSRSKQRSRLPQLPSRALSFSLLSLALALTLHFLVSPPVLAASLLGPGAGGYRLPQTRQVVLTQRRFRLHYDPSPGALSTLQAMAAFSSILEELHQVVQAQEGPFLSATDLEATAQLGRNTKLEATRDLADVDSNVAALAGAQHVAGHRGRQLARVLQREAGDESSRRLGSAPCSPDPGANQSQPVEVQPLPPQALPPRILNQTNQTTPQNRTTPQNQTNPLIPRPVNLSDLPPLPILSKFNATNGTQVVLAVNRTRRQNPLDHFSYYSGGWDFYATGYWMSLSWTTVYGAAVGVAWAVFGLGFVAFLVGTWCCCKQRWTDLRDEAPKYDKADLMLPLVFMGVGVAIACAGLGTSIAGAVKFNSAAQNMTNFAASEVQSVSNVILNVTNVLLNVNSSHAQMGYTLPASASAKYSSVLSKASSVATDVRTTAESGQQNVSKVLKIIQQVLLALTCVTVGFVLVACVFGILKWVVFSNVMAVIIWTLIVLTWVFVTVFVFVWLFSGDTSAAFGEVSVSPTANSPASRVVPCLDPAVTNNLNAYASYIGYSAIIIVNRTVAAQAPGAFRAMGRPGGLCNPYTATGVGQGKPAYTYNASNTCSAPPVPCNLRPRKCRAARMSIQDLSQRMMELPCNGTNTGTCIDRNLQNKVLAGKTLVQNMAQIPPLLVDTFKCGYVQYLATNIATGTSQLEYSATLLWIGFLLISVGAMVFVICLPIYVYRGVRCYDGVNHDGEYNEGDGEDNDEWDDMEEGEDPKKLNQEYEYSDEERDNIGDEEAGDGRKQGSDDENDDNDGNHDKDDGEEDEDRYESHDDRRDPDESDDEYYKRRNARYESDDYTSDRDDGRTRR